MNSNDIGELLGWGVVPSSRKKNGPKVRHLPLSLRDTTSTINTTDNTPIYIAAQFAASRRGKKELKSSREKSKARTVVGREGEEPATWPRIWLTTRREREQKGEDNKWDGKKKRKKKILVWIRPLSFHHTNTNTPITGWSYNKAPIKAWY